MEQTQPPLISATAYVPVSGKNATPFSQQTVVLTKQDYIALKWEANYWRAQHARLVQREAALKAPVGLPPFCITWKNVGSSAARVCRAENTRCTQGFTPVNRLI